MPHYGCVAAPTVQPAQQLDPTAAILAAVATHECNRFRGRNLRIRNSHVVHGTREMPWIAGLMRPGPGCDQGWGGFGAELSPTDEPVNCGNCLHSTQARAAPRFVHVGPGQLALDLDVDGHSDA